MDIHFDEHLGWTKVETGDQPSAFLMLFDRHLLLKIITFIPVFDKYDCYREIVK